jgi:hypothetical protein
MRGEQPSCDTKVLQTRLFNGIFNSDKLNLTAEEVNKFILATDMMEVLASCGKVNYLEKMWN